MNFKTAFAAAALISATASSLAVPVSSYKATYVQGEGGDWSPYGFAKGTDGPARPDLFDAGSATRGNLPGGSPAPSALSYNFHDLWAFNGLPPGVYEFDTTITAAGSTTFSLVMFEWYSNYTLNSIVFTISDDQKSAHGVGSFTVDPGCDLSYCVYTHIFGWDDGQPGNGYAGDAVAQVVPEPTPALMLLAGLGALGWLARRRPAA